MDKRVYGVLGISAIMANWNADFSGYPKTITSGEIFGSDKALKYPMKKMWDDQGDKVLYIKSLRFEKGKKGATSLIPRSLKERYEQLFQVEDLKKNTDVKEVLEQLLQKHLLIYRLQEQYSLDRDLINTKNVNHRNSQFFLLSEMQLKQLKKKERQKILH